MSLFIFCLVSLFFLKTALADELANVNGTSITTEEFMKNMAQVPPQEKSQYSSPEGKKRVLNFLVERELLSQEAKKTGLDKDPVYLEEVEQAKKQILVNLIAQKIGQEKINEEEIHSYFNKNIKDFQLVRASHILVKTEEEALKVKKELSAGGNFEELAKKYSIDPGSAQKKGDLGFFNRKQMVQPFADLAFSLKPNEMGGPVKTQFGYHLIKVMEVKNPKFEELTQENKRTIQTGIMNNEIEKLKSKGKVKINEEALKKLN
ncbi:MAG: peptidylprolyl isomerase [Nitrospirae bacterium]|nr:peptidylprolyl isomerase [Nitrospirota bacterium]MBI3352111.1 peptidylprolyl isomerase [Nitrospirota bacterium]